MIFGGFGLLLTYPFGNVGFMVNGLSLFSKLCIAASFSVIYIHSSEIFPTSIRNGALGLVGVSARLGGVLAPLMLTTSLAPIIFGILMVTAGGFNLTLPETKGKKLLIWSFLFQSKKNRIGMN